MFFKDLQIKTERKSYVYSHTRLDNNEIFYIGIGVHRKDDKYKRAFKKDRSLFWKNIVNKTNYSVNILLDDLTWVEACEKEKEFILMYGRKNLGTGTLVNLTNGGEGAIKRVYSHSKETRLKIGTNTPKLLGEKNHNFGKKLPKEVRDKISKANKGRKHSIEAKLKIRIANKNRKHTEESKNKISIKNKGKIRTPKMILNMSIAQKNKKLSDEAKLNISLSKRGDNHPSSKLSKEDVIEIRRMYDDNIKVKEIAKNYNICNSSVEKIGRRIRWSHL